MAFLFTPALLASASAYPRKYPLSLSDILGSALPIVTIMSFSFSLNAQPPCLFC
nr:MAG TPA: hypothetical protein [Caudoviricetes sp.]